MNVNSIIAKVSDIIIRKTYWFNEIMFPDCAKFANHQEFNLEIINLGSSAAKYAFNYSGLNIKAANWAMSPQTFIHDNAILNNYLSYLKSGATVIIPLCPFSALGGGEEYFPDKYYSVLRPISIPNYSLRKRDEVMRIYRNPRLYFPMAGLIREFRVLLKTNAIHLAPDQMEADANNRIMAWMKEFSIYDLHNPLSLVNIDRFDYSAIALSAIIDSCLNHGFKPVIVLPPISRHLAAKIDSSTRTMLIYDFISQANKQHVPVFDYMDNLSFQKDSYFSNSFFMNDNGAKMFTDELVKHLL